MHAPVNRQTDRDWVDRTLDSLRDDGYAVVEGVLDRDLVSRTETALHRVSQRLDEEFGHAVRASHGDACILRLPMKYDPHFLALLENPVMLTMVDAYMSPSAVLRYQVGSIYLPQTPPELRPPNGIFHQNFPAFSATSPLALDVVLLASDMTPQSAPLHVVPGSHRLTQPPAESRMARTEIPLAAPAGSMILVDGSLWHREIDIGDKPSLFVSHQFTHPLVKPHFDYPRALGAAVMESLSGRCRHLLGWNFRAPESLADFYVPEPQRPFRSSMLRMREFTG